MQQRFLVPLLAASISLLAPISAQAQYQFTRIVEFTGPFESTGTPAALNDSGQVAFGASFNGQPGIFVGNGGPITTVADTSGDFNFFGFTSIAGNGLVSYFGIKKDGTAGFYAGPNGAITLIDDAGGAVAGFGGDTHSSTSGPFTTFHVFTPGGGQRIFTTTGGALTPIADNSGEFDTFDVDPHVNASGQVAFHARRDNGVDGIFVGSGGTPTLIADTAGQFAFLSSTPGINDNGDVVFGALLDNFSDGIFIGNGGSVSTFLDSSGPFAPGIGFGPLAINNQGQVAFFGTLDSGESGLFVGSDPVRDRVLLIGQAFDGSFVTNISIFGDYFNNAGQLAFTVDLEDGRQQVLLASPTAAPEANSLALLLSLGTVALFFRRRRNLTSAP